MSQADYPAAADGRYWLGISVGGTVVSCMLDTGLVDPLHRIGFELEHAIYDQLRMAEQLRNKVCWHSAQDEESAHVLGLPAAG